MKLVSFVISALLVVASSGVSAQHHDGHDKKARVPKFESMMDTNNDGKISKAEAMARAEAQFNSADTNGDGFLSMEEAMSRHKERREKMRERIEKRGNNSGISAQ